MLTSPPAPTVDPTATPNVLLMQRLLRQYGQGGDTPAADGSHLPMLLASHENSRTVQGHDGRWYNVHGETGQPLPPRTAGEAPSYATMEEAVAAAKARSRSFDMPPPGLPPAGSNAPVGPSNGPQMIPLRDYLKQQQQSQNGGREGDPNSPVASPPAEQVAMGPVKLQGGSGVQGDPGAAVTNMKWWQSSGTPDQQVPDAKSSQDPHGVLVPPIESNPTPDWAKSDTPGAIKRVPSLDEPPVDKNFSRKIGTQAGAQEEKRPRPVMTEQDGQHTPMRPPASLAAFQPKDLTAIRLLKMLHPNDPEVDKWLEQAERGQQPAPQSQYMRIPGGAPPVQAGPPTPMVPGAPVPGVDPRVIGPPPSILNWYRQRLGMPPQ